MNYNELIANSNTAFGAGEYDKALDFAQKAIKIENKSEEGYDCAGRACMVLCQDLVQIKMRGSAS